MLYLAGAIAVCLIVLARAMLRDGDCPICGHLYELHDYEGCIAAGIRGVDLACGCRPR